MKARGLSNLSAPRSLLVAPIPKLGTGKVDHRSAAKLALECGTTIA